MMVLMICLVLDTDARDEGFFFAFYTRIDSGEEFEKDARVGRYADIIVQVAPGLEVVFWRGTSYLPFLHSGDRKPHFRKADLHHSMQVKLQWPASEDSPVVNPCFRIWLRAEQTDQTTWVFIRENEPGAIRNRVY